MINTSSMEMHSFFSTYIFPLVSPSIAISVGYVAFQQWRTAKDKLRFDLYERRLAVYDAAANYIEFGLKRGQESSPDEEKIQSAYVRAWREARFLFGKDSKVYSLLQNMQHHVLVVSQPHDSATVLYSPETHKANLERKTESIRWITRAFDQFSDEIEPYLVFKHSKIKHLHKHSNSNADTHKL